MPLTNTRLDLRILTVGQWQENTYLLVDPATNQSLLIDPGDEAGRILRWLEDTEVRSVVLTHAHRDHLGALPEVRTALGVQVGLHPADAELAAKNDIAADFALQDGQVIQLAGQTIRLVHIPGHTPGSVGLRFDRRALVGDAIFPGGPGHTNTPEQLDRSLASLQRTVFTWPDGIELYPGHGAPTTVGRERAGFERFIARPRPAGLCGDVTWEMPSHERGS